MINLILLLFNIIFLSYVTIFDLSNPVFLIISVVSLVITIIFFYLGFLSRKNPYFLVTFFIVTFIMSIYSNQISISIYSTIYSILSLIVWNKSNIIIPNVNYINYVNKATIPKIDSSEDIDEQNLIGNNQFETILQKLDSHEKVIKNLEIKNIKTSYTDLDKQIAIDTQLKYKNFSHENQNTIAKLITAKTYNKDIMPNLFNCIAIFEQEITKILTTLSVDCSQKDLGLLKKINILFEDLKVNKIDNQLTLNYYQKKFHEIREKRNILYHGSSIENVASFYDDFLDALTYLNNIISFYH